MFRKLILILFIALFMQPLWAKGDNVVILTTHDLKPYGYLNKQGLLVGSAVKVVRCAMDAINQPYEIIVVPWKRAQAMVQSNQAHGFFAASQNAARDKGGAKSEVIAEQNWMWYVTVDSKFDPMDPNFKDTAFVTSFLGANMQKWLSDNEYHLSVDPPINTENLLLTLLHNRYDAVLANDQVMGALLKKHNAEDKVRTTLNRSKPLSVYFSNKFIARNMQFLAAFNRSVLECRATE